MSTFNMPMSNSRDALRFSPEPSSFDYFFEDVAVLAQRASLSETDTIKWAIRYAGAESESWRQVPCLVPGRAPAPTFKEFQEEVRKVYPHLSASRRYTHEDLERLVDRTRDFRDMTRDDFGDYYRRFITYTAYLISKDRLSKRERNSYYLRGFPQPIRARILQRLSVKKPDVLPDEGYDFEDIHEAASFVLNGGDRGGDSREAAHVPKQEPADQGSIGELVRAMSDLTRVFTTTVQGQAQQSLPPPRFPRPVPGVPTPGGVVQNAPRWNQPRPQQGQDQYQQGCMFCSATDHFVRACPTAAQYLQQGKAILNEYGRIALPDGSYPSRNIPGKNMRERLDNYWASFSEQEGPNVVSTNFLEGPDECVFAFDISPPSDPYESNTQHPYDPSQGPYSADYEDNMSPLEQAQLIQAQIDSLREAQVLALQKGGRKQQFDGIEIMKRTGPPRRDGRIPPPPPPQGPTVNARGPPPPSQVIPKPTQTTSKPTQPSAPVPNVFGRPGARAGDRPYQRPQGPMRPVAMPPKPSADGQKFHYQSPVESDVKASDITDRALDTKVTISTRELLAVSPDVRRQFRELVSGKKVLANIMEVDETDTYLADCMNIEPESLDPPAVYFDLVKYDNTSSAAPSLPLRVIFPLFAPGVEPECILDGGAQVVVMRKDIWEQLRAPIVANKAIPMESANATTTKTLGLIENHPVQLGPITIYLQIQVVENAPFEVLLGRPFFDITSCSEISTPGGHHEIHIKHPNTGVPYVFATQPRIRKNRRDAPQSEAVANFRQ